MRNRSINILFLTVLVISPLNGCSGGNSEYWPSTSRALFYRFALDGAAR